MSANLPSPIPPLGPTTGRPPAAAPSRFKPVDPLRVIRQYLWLLIALFVFSAVASGGLWYLLLKQAPQYTSRAQLRVIPPAPPDSPRMSEGMHHQQRMDVIETYIQNEIMHLRSQEILLATLDRSEVQQTRWFQKYGHDIHQARERLEQKHLNVSMIRGSTLINVQVSTRHEDDAAPILYALIDVYLQQVRQEQSQGSEGMRSTYTTERDRWANTVDQMQREIRSFLTREDLSSLEARHSESNVAYQHLASSRVELSLMLDQMRESYRSQQEMAQAGEIEPTQEQLVEIEQRPGIEQLNAQLRALRAERETQLATFGPSHIRIKQLDNRIVAVEAERDREMRRMIRELQAARMERTAKDIQSLEGQIAALQPRLREAAGRLTDLNDRLVRYNQLQEQLEYARMKRDQAEEALANIRVQGTRPDAVPVRRQVGPTLAELTFPRLLVIPLATLALMGLGSGLIFLREMLDQRVRSPQDVRALADAELLGMLPDAREDPTGPGRIERVVTEDPTGLMAEAFRQVRTAMLMKMDRRGYKTLVLAAAQAGTGTSAVTHNLAASLAISGRSVLVIDANLRRPMQHQYGQGDNARGLVQLLQGDARLEELVQQSAEHNLAVLPTGDTSHAAPELLDTPRFRSLLSEAERLYDLILIDAPPALLAADTQLMAKHVDAIALVIRADRDQRGMIDRMIRQLDGQRADILGLILNGVRPSAGGYLKRNFQDYYSYRQNGSHNVDRKRLAKPEPQGTA